MYRLLGYLETHFNKFLIKFDTLEDTQMNIVQCTRVRGKFPVCTILYVQLVYREERLS